MSKFMNRPPPNVTSTSISNSSTFVEKLMIGLDAPNAFDLRGQLIGANGANLNYIRNETGAIVTLRGHGSLFIDPAIGIESPEPMHLYIEHTRFDGLQSAKQLAKNLIETLQQEIIHFQQMNPPVPSIQFAQQPVQPVHTIQQTHPQLISSQQAIIPQMSVPPPMLAVPPPQIQPKIEQINTVTTSIMQQNHIAQSTPTMVTAMHQPSQVQVTQSQPQAIIQQQAIIPQTIQLHQPGNMVIHQQPTNNLNVPPPNIHIPMKQAPPPVPTLHLSQPPPNIQLQTQQATQIVLNQPQTNYQYQYVQQQPGADANLPPNQVTIQHIYQPQGIIQQTAQSVNQLTQRHSQPQQQYIVQGNTAYAVPPPNIIHQHPPPQPIQSQQHQPIIFQTISQPANQIPLQHIQLHPPPNMLEQAQQNINGNEEANNVVKEEKSTPEPSESPAKQEEKSEAENHEANPQPHEQQLPVQSMQVPPPMQFTTSAINAITHCPPPNVPPPSMHIVSNALITSTAQPTATQTHQIYSQLPVSLQQLPQIPPPQSQQIHVSTSGQHFLVNTQQWAPQQQQFQQVTQNMQNVQSFITAPHTLRNNEVVMVSNPTIIQTSSHQPQQPPSTITTSFQQHLSNSMAGIQFHNLPQHTQVVQTIENPPQILQDPQQQPHPPQPIQYQQAPQPVPYPNQLHEQQRVALKRKRDNDEDSMVPRHMMPPRMGMGAGQQFINVQRDVHPMQSSNANVDNNNLSVVSTTSTAATNQDDFVPPPNGNNFAFKPRPDGHRYDPRMPTHPNASVNVNQMMIQRPPRFHMNNMNMNNNLGPGNFQMHRLPPPPPPPMAKSWINKNNAENVVLKP